MIRFQPAARVVVSACLGILACSLARPCFADAYVSPQGTLDVSLGYNWSLSHDHLLGAGYSYCESTSQLVNGVCNSGIRRQPGGHDVAHTAVLAVDYAVIDNLGVSISLPYVVSRYIGQQPGHQSDQDNGDFHGNLQDLQAEVRYSFQPGDFGLAVAPSLGLVLPTHNYDNTAHSAAGRGYREIRFGMNLGYTIADAVYLQGKYTFNLSESVTPPGQDIAISTNQSTGWLQAGYFILDWLGVFVNSDLLITHGGLPFGSADLNALAMQNNSIYPTNLARANFIRVGGGASFKITESVNFSAAFTKMVWGESTGDAQALIAFLTWENNILTPAGETFGDTL